MKKSTLTYLLFGFLFGIGFLAAFYIREPRVKFGEHYIYCNPKAKINLKKSYHLQLWDYNWPIKDSKMKYRTYLLQAIRDFQKIYPNVHVEIKLLDLISGPAQLEQALKKNDGPDLYCSAYMIPKFNFKRQIPVGFYLKKAEQEEYFSNIKQMLTYKGTLCYFPRWIAPEFWIANQALMESAGLSVTKIQKNGWTWQDLSELRKRIAGVKYILVGDLGAKGFFTQLVDSAKRAPHQFGNKQELNITIDLIDTLIDQKAVPPDCHPKMLGRFLEGKAVLLAGLRPVMYNYIVKRHKSNDANWQPVLLPVPTRFANNSSISVENGAIAIYRNRRTAGDDHLTVAMKFGRYLSCYQKTDPWEYLMVSPAAKSVYNMWIRKLPQNQEIYNRLIEIDLTKKLILKCTHASSYPDKLYPILNDFITKKITGAELKSKLNE